MSARMLVAYALALCALAGSGVLVAQRAQEVRQLHTALDALRREQDRLLAEHSRLLLERGALAAYQNVESAAAERLAMHFPETVERLDR